MRPLRSDPCPYCSFNRVWSASHEGWRCPDCNWTDGMRTARAEAIDESRDAYRRRVERVRDPNRWRP